MRPGTKPKPTVLHQLHGTVRTPHRQRPPDAEAPGDLASMEPPADLSPVEAASWRYHLEHAPRGVLKPIDRNILRAWVQAEAIYLGVKEQQDKLNARGGLPYLVKAKSGELVVSPYVYVLNKSLTQMLRMAELLGFCPSGRVGLGGDGGEGEAPDDWRWLELEAMRKKAANSAA